MSRGPAYEPVAYPGSVAVDPAAGADDSDLSFALLGTVRAYRAGRELEPGSPRQRAVLAMLALRVNRVVSRDELVDGVWGSDPPATAVNALHIAVSALRRTLEPGRARRAPARLLTSVGSGYRLAVPAGHVDATVFEEQLRRARRLLATGDPAGALRAFDAALDLWHGAPLTGIAGPFAQIERTRLTELRLAATEARAELLIELGQLDAATAQLRRLAGEHPLREHARALLMRSLHRAGRQADALRVYADTRALLAVELGVEPGAALRREHADILGGGAGPDSRRTDPPPVVPRQLPATIGHFTGRQPELDTLTRLIDRPRAGCRAPVVITIDGTAGVGKTALAVHWAHQVADRYPDGQLYANLRGFDPQNRPAPADEAIRGFLDALAVRTGELPAGPDARAALYRSLLADRRMAVVLDNAASTDQVRPLLPGSPGCLVVVTGRQRLSGLVALQGAHPVTLDVLPADQARGQLASHLGAARLAAEPDAADDVVAACAGLPLALAIVAARIAARPGAPLRALADELLAARGGLDAFNDPDLTANARVAFSWSYQRLSGPAARAFRLFGLHPGADVTVAAAASLTGLPRERVSPALDELCRAHLLSQYRPGRFTTHDLLRAYAGERTRIADPEAERQAAVRRLLEHYAYASYAAARLLNPQRQPIPLAPPGPGCAPEEFSDHQQALTWFTEELQVLLAALGYAADAGHDAVLRPFAWGLTVFLQRRGHRQEWVQVQQAALAAEQRLGDRAAVAGAHRHLARAYLSLGRFTDAHGHLAQALEVFQADGDLRGQAHTQLNLGMLLERTGRHREALEPTRRALDLFSAVDDAVMQARSRGAIGWLHAHLGEYRAAVVHCHGALRVLTSLGDGYGQASTLDSLGFTYQQLGEYRKAIASYRRALALRRDLGDLVQRGDHPHPPRRRPPGSRKS